MKIVLTGGKTGGHFYPLIAVSEELQKQATEQKLLPPQLFYIAPDPYDERALFEHQIEFRQAPAGKLRRYFSLLNYIDFVKTAIGIILSIIQLYRILPDVVFSKGGFASFPTVLAARFLRIPVVIHESDAIPGRTNIWAGKFARSIALSYPEAGSYFPDANVAHTGNPIRSAILHPAKEGAHTYLKLEENIPVILILGGSLGAEQINNIVLESLSVLLNDYQVIHQTGTAHLESVEGTTNVILENHPHKSRYHAYGYLHDLAMQMAAGVAELVISRAGSTIFEIAAWGVPSIIVPIPQTISRDQHRNAYAYAATGGCIVIEQENFSPHILQSEVTRLMEDPALRESLGSKAKTFARLDASKKIASELIKIALEHEDSE